MKPEIPYVLEKIDSFNRLYFGGELPPIPVRLASARTFLGKITYKYKRGPFGRIKGYTDCVMAISKSFDYSGPELEDVIIHEMIHYYILYKGIKDTSSHGVEFRRIMDTINTEYGRNVRIRHNLKPDTPVPARRTSRSRVVLVSVFKDGKTGVTVCTAAKAPSIKRALPRYYSLESVKMYSSADPFFDRYPLSRTPKIYRITREELAACTLLDSDLL